MTNIPIFTYNLNDFEIRHLIKGLSSNNRTTNLSAFSKQSGMYHSIAMKGFEFKDFSTLLNYPLEDILRKLVEKGHEFPILDQSGLIPLDKPEIKHLLTKKMYFPQCHFDSPIAFQEKQLPGKEFFVTKSHGKMITESQYAEACKMFKDLKCDTFGDYMSNYSLLNVILLCEVAFAFREKMFSLTQLDPLQYDALPSFSFDIFLKKFSVRMDCPSNIKMGTLLDDQVLHLLLFTYLHIYKFNLSFRCEGHYRIFPPDMKSLTKSLLMTQLIIMCAKTLSWECLKPMTSALKGLIL